MMRISYVAARNSELSPLSFPFYKVRKNQYFTTIGYYEYLQMTAGALIDDGDAS
jgi:hypothetical protein